MGILSWLVVGLIAGWLAGLVMRGSGYGILSNIVIGILGALLGGWLAGALLGVPDPLSGFNLGTILVATLGAIVLILLIRLLPGRSRV